MRSAVPVITRMASTTQDVPASALPQVCEDPAEVILRLLEAATPDWTEVATLAIREPALLHKLLLGIAEEAADDACDTLRTGLTARVEALLRLAGVDLLRACLLLSQWSGPRATDIAALRRTSDALTLAECTRHLAMETRYPYPDEAYLAGLFHLFEFDQVRGAPPGHQARPDGMALWRAGLTEQGREDIAGSRLLSAALVDALCLRNITDEQCRTAHPLLRILHAARLLARHDWPEHAPRITALTGLQTDALASLRADTRYLAGASPVEPQRADEHDPGALAHRVAPALPIGTASFRDAALSGLVRLAFDGLTAQAIAQRYRLACRLLGGIRPPVLLVTEADERLRALDLGINPKFERFIDELDLRLEDEASVIARTARSARPTSWTFDSLTLSRSLIDLQIGRRFGSEGFDCIPLASGPDRGVAIRGRSVGHPPACGDSLMSTLCNAALGAWTSLRRREAARDDAARNVEQRFREHARKLAHEANNPLAIIRSYLEVMSQRHPETQELGPEVAVINAEIDRLTDLVRAFGHPPAPKPEPSHCALATLLNELRTLYAPTLFDQRGIQFEIRVATGLPDVAMPASRLKQVIINLFRNASEALQPGGRFSVVVPGQLISNGVPCIEIRVIDNGPGLPHERLLHLFEPQVTSKGGDHQGLGLAVVREVLAESGAYILCRSQTGTGTSFQILVPIFESK